MKMSSTKIVNGTKKQKVTIQDVLDTIRKYKTESPSEIAGKLGCTRMTIYRKLEQIPHEQIEAIFKELAESELKPIEMQYEVFRELPEMQEYAQLLSRSQVSKAYKNELLRGVFNLAKHFKKRPKSLDVAFIENLADTLLNLKDGKIKVKGLGNESTFRKVIRSWYIYHGISGKLLTSKGIGGEQGEGYGKRAKDKIPRIEFMECLKTVLTNEGYEKEIPTWNSLVYWLFYSGTRITATLKIEIEAIKWNNDNLENIQTIGKALVVDKGRHKKGRTKWDKLIVGALKKRILENLRNRNNPQEGLLFNGLYPQKVRTMFKKAYKMANIKVHQPAHIWRHTASQELLDATDWNYEIVASILGWKDTKTLKECYGKMGESVRERALKKAMGIPIKEEPKYFRLLPEDMAFPIKA